MAQLNDLLILGKSAFIGDANFSGMINAHGGIKLSSSTAESSGLTYVLGIKAFADGGNIIWSNASNVTVGQANSATKATQDGSGNTITSYYCTLSTTQTISGAKTFSNPITSSYASSTWINSANKKSAINLTGAGYTGWISGPSKNGRLVISSYPGSNDNLYFGYMSNTDITAGTNAFTKQMYWSGGDGLLVVDKISTKINVNASAPTSGTSYFPIFTSTGTTDYASLKVYSDYYYYYNSAYSSLNIGKTTKKGILSLWLNSINTDIIPSATSSATITLPNRTGTLALIQTWNDFMHNTNEFTFAKSAYSGYIWLNYRTASGTTDGAITGYKFGNGKGNMTGVTVEAETFKGNLTGNVTGNVTGSVSGTSGGLNANVSNIELNSGGTLASYGGFIDFHFHDANKKPLNASGTVVSATPDYTSRIIENAAGQIAINSVTIKGSTITGTLSGNASTATALTSSAGSTGQAIYFSSGKPAVIDWRIGNQNVGEHNCNNIAYNFCGYYTSNGPTTSLGATTNDGTIWAQAYSSSWVTQIAQDYRNGNLFVRGKNNGTWTAWKRIAVATEIYRITES